MSSWGSCGLSAGHRVRATDSRRTGLGPGQGCEHPLPQRATPHVTDPTSDVSSTLPRRNAKRTYSGRWQCFLPHNKLLIYILLFPHCPPKSWLSPAPRFTCRGVGWFERKRSESSFQWCVQRGLHVSASPQPSWLTSSTAHFLCPCDFKLSLVFGKKK